MSTLPTHTAEITRDATRERLPELLAVLDRTVGEAGGGEALLFPLHLATEEACTNVVMHGYAGRKPGPLTLRVIATPEAVTVAILDEASVFDPATAPAPDLDADAMERPIGGLGWHLVYEVMDEVRHEARPGGGNQFTLVKHRTPS